MKLDFRLAIFVNSFYRKFSSNERFSLKLELWLNDFLRGIFCWKKWIEIYFFDKFIYNFLISKFRIFKHS